MIPGPIISASILSADFAHLANEVNAVLAAGVDYIHFDVMDHHYVPNLSFGAGVCSALRHAGITAPIDVHLMVTEPVKYIAPFAKAGANLVTFHPETVNDVRGCIAQIRDHGMQVGLAINPDQSLELVINHLAEIDLLLLMSVIPGFAGQSFIPDSLSKISAARRALQSLERSIWLAVDGGINISNIGEIVNAGANFCILGSGLFNSESYEQRVTAVKAQIANLSAESC